MSTPLRMNAGDAVVHRFLEQATPLFDPAQGEMPSADELVALGEGRLLPVEEAALVARMRQSAAARAELRAVYPTRHARLFGQAPLEVGAEVVRFPTRPVIAAGAALAAAAALFLLLQPAGPPAGSGFDVVPAKAQAIVRGVDPLRALPGDGYHLMMRLGTPSVIDGWRGSAPWGALIQADDTGVRVLCTSDEARCRASDGTLGAHFQAPPRPGEQVWFAFVVAGGPVAADRLDAVIAAANAAGASGTGLADHLRAADIDWQVHGQRPIEVVRP